MTDTNNKTDNLTHADLAQFSGDMERFQTLNRHVIYTPGIQFLAERAGAYWLIDLIASYYGTPQMKQAMAADPRLETLHFWRLDVRSDQTAIVRARADSGEEPFITQEIPFTDFPLEYVDVWSGCDGHFWTLYLPSEH